MRQSSDPSAPLYLTTTTETGPFESNCFITQTGLLSGPITTIAAEIPGSSSSHRRDPVVPSYFIRCPVLALTELGSFNVTTACPSGPTAMAEPPVWVIDVDHSTAPLARWYLTTETVPEATGWPSGPTRTVLIPPSWTALQTNTDPESAATKEGAKHISARRSAQEKSAASNLDFRYRLIAPPPYAFERTARPSDQALSSSREVTGSWDHYPVQGI